jgi:hypothetical protein
MASASGRFPPAGSRDESTTGTFLTEETPPEVAARASPTVGVSGSGRRWAGQIGGEPFCNHRTWLPDGRAVASNS